MKCVLFSEQHLSNNVGEIVFKMNSSLLAIHSVFFYQDLCYEEMPLLSSCPFHQVRRVGNTQKCSINKCTLFCLAKLQYKYFLTHPGYLPHLLIYFFYALLLVQVKRDQKPLNHWGPSQDCKSSQWTLDSKGPFLKTWRRWYLGGEL